MEKKNIFQKIPEKSKAFINRMKEDWKSMNVVEKAGVIATAVVLDTVLAGVLADVIGRYEFKKKQAKLTEVI